jgi:cytochrome c551/c552
MRTLLRAAALSFVIALVIQAVPVTRDNPPVTGPIQAPAPIAATLRRACFDCHSHETTWPWYSRIAPASWLVAHDVHEGREHVNFSTWMSLSPDEQRKRFLKMAEEIEKGAMPPGIYTPMHPDARLSLQDITTIAEWARGSAK